MNQPGEKTSLRDRFTTAAAQLGDDNLSVRLAGVYAMAALADEWLARRDADKRADEEAQVCIEVLCAYVRADASPVQGQLPQDDDADYPQWDVEVRQAVVSTIAKRLRGEYPAWAGRTFDFTGSRFSGQFDLNETHLGSPDTTVIFYRACFSAGRVDLRHTVFSGGLVDFGEAKFSGAYVYFDEAELSGGIVDFSGASFTRGYLDFERATFCGGVLDFDDAEFSGGAVDFRWAAFQGRRMFAIHEDVKFGSARFAGARVDFRRAKFAGGNVDFRGAHFSDGVVDFRQAEFSGGAVYFVEVRSSDGQLRPVRGSYFVEAMFSGERSTSARQSSPAEKSALTGQNSRARRSSSVMRYSPEAESCSMRLRRRMSHGRPTGRGRPGSLRRCGRRGREVSTRSARHTGRLIPDRCRHRRTGPRDAG